MAVRRTRAVLALEPPDAVLLRSDVIQLVDDRVQLRNPGIGGAAIEPFLARAIERLIAEARQRERDQIVDLMRVDRDDRRFRDEPLGSARNRTGDPIAPEVAARIARRQRQTVTGGDGAVGLRSAETAEDQHVRHVDERQRRHASNDVSHQEREAVREIDHAFGRLRITGKALRQAERSRTCRNDFVVSRAESGSGSLDRSFRRRASGVSSRRRGRRRLSTGAADSTGGVTAPCVSR